MELGMTTGWGEAQTCAETSEAGGAFAPARTDTADDAVIASDACATLPASRGVEGLPSQPPEWPEKAIYVYI